MPRRPDPQPAEFQALTPGAWPANMPEWARRAIDAYRPSVAYGSEHPNKARFGQWQAMRERLGRRWHELAPDGWRVPKDHSAYAGLIRAGYLHPPADCVRQAILESAIESAWELASGREPVAVVDAVRRVDELNEEISELAKLLARKFRARQQYLDDFLLNDRGADAEECSPDPFELAGAVEQTLIRTNQAHRQIGLVLSAAPTWADTLETVADRMPRVVGPMDAADLAVIGGATNKTEWSPWLQRLIARLGGWFGFGLPDGFLLRCLTNEQIASLAVVVFDAPDGAKINGEQVRKLRARNLKRKGEPDDSAPLI